MEALKVAIIGGGAAGFFAAIQAKKNHPSAGVTLLEKSSKLLSKVRISGGGRCNVTNGCSNVDELVQAYPRGGRSLKRMFHVFNTTDTKAWFEERGVPLYTQDDGRVFPVSDDSASIVDCLMGETKRLGIAVQRGVAVKSIRKDGGQLVLECRRGKAQTESLVFDKVIVATGGSPTRKGLLWLETLGHKIEEPVPSLFTFNMPAEGIRQLMGVAVDRVLVQIHGTKLKSEGSLLITHWGMSGPAILKLSAFGARTLHELDYHFNIRINWVGEKNNEIVQERLNGLSNAHPHKQLANLKPFELPKKLWLYLLDKYDISSQKKWGN